ncbi:nucleotidyltransferase domain-containing protein [Persephonella sp.]
MKTKELKTIRLTEYELKAIKETAREVFGNEAKVWLFGSRVNPELKGGDIDIYVEIPDYKETDVFKKKIKFLIKLEEQIGEQKIDLIVAPYNCKEFYCIEAKKTGIRIL